MNYSREKILQTLFRGPSMDCRFLSGLTLALDILTLFRTKALISNRGCFFQNLFV